MGGLCTVHFVEHFFKFFFVKLIKLFPLNIIGNIEDDSHISTASEGAYCGIYYEDMNSELRKVFLDSIHNSSIQRIIWISTKEPSEEITSIENLTYIKYVEEENYMEKVLELEEVEEIKDSIIYLK